MLEPNESRTQLDKLKVRNCSLRPGPQLTDLENDTLQYVEYILTCAQNPTVSRFYLLAHTI